MLLVITTYGASKGYYDPDFSATPTLPQRTLMAPSTCFAFYLLCGATVFARIEGWLFVDGVYWATITFLTIAYGDTVPITHLGRSFIIPYAIVGIVMLGLVVGSVGALVLDRASEKMGPRMTAKEQEKLRAEFESASSKFKKDENDPQTRKTREFELMRQVQSRELAPSSTGLPSESPLSPSPSYSSSVLESSTNRSHPRHLSTALRSYFQVIYFCFISLTTIGYGDFAIHSIGGRPLFVFRGLLAVPTVTIIIASMGATVLVVVKAIIAKFDGFMVLPHETNGNRNSFSKKALQVRRLKVEAK